MDELSLAMTIPSFLLGNKRIVQKNQLNLLELFCSMYYTVKGCVSCCDKRLAISQLNHILRDAWSGALVD